MEFLKFTLKINGELVVDFSDDDMQDFAKSYFGNPEYITRDCLMHMWEYRNGYAKSVSRTLSKTEIGVIDLGLSPGVKKEDRLAFFNFSLQQEE